jgi:hypothetical protein
MDLELYSLSGDEMELVKRFRNADRLGRARIYLATNPAKTSTLYKEDANELELIANYLATNDYGRGQMRKAAEILARPIPIEEARALVAELCETRPRCEVIDISKPRLE